MIDGGNQFPKVQQIGASLPLAEKDSARRNRKNNFLSSLTTSTNTAHFNWVWHSFTNRNAHLSAMEFPFKKRPRKQGIYTIPSSRISKDVWLPHLLSSHFIHVFFNTSAADKLIDVSWINIGTPHLSSMEVWAEFDNFLDFIYLHSSSLLYRITLCHHIRKRTCMETMNKLNSHKMQWKKIYIC